MRSYLKAALQEHWEDAYGEQKRLSSPSVVPVLDALLAAGRTIPSKIGSRLAPRIGHEPQTQGDEALIQVADVQELAWAILGSNQ